MGISMMNNPSETDSLTFSLYLYRLYKSKYLEENKGTVMKQDDINANMDSKKLLYLFNTDLPDGDYLKKLKEYGTEVDVSGYSYNLSKLALVLSRLMGTNIESGDIVIVNNEAEGVNKILTLFDYKRHKNYKLTINENNKTLIIPKTFKSYGINMLCVDEVENITTNNEFIISTIIDSVNKNGGYITDIKKLFVLKDLVPKKFIRNWMEDNMLVSIVINDYYTSGDYYEYFEDCDLFDDDGEEF